MQHTHTLQGTRTAPSTLLARMEDAATWATLPLVSRMGMEYAMVYAPASETLEYSVKDGWRRATALRNLRSRRKGNSRQQHRV
jgi:hypothetical protein